jgi:hypothetical protein
MNWTRVMWESGEEGVNAEGLWESWADRCLLTSMLGRQPSLGMCWEPGGRSLTTGRCQVDALC